MATISTIDPTIESLADQCQVSPDTIRLYCRELRKAFNSSIFHHKPRQPKMRAEDAQLIIRYWQLIKLWHKETAIEMLKQEIFG